MKDIQISLFASAVRTKDWMTFYNSLQHNTINYEVVFCGNVRPEFTLPDNFKFIFADVKPAQAYQISANACRGELCGWTCDDATYEADYTTAQKNLDKVYNFYKSINNRKTIIAMRTIEDGRDIFRQHHFFGKWTHTPVMAPMAVMNRELFNEIGGYDRNFISGQAENDIVMRVNEIGGKVEIAMDSLVYIHHRKCHVGGVAGEHKSMIRQHYVADRQVLENLWVKEGYGCYGEGGTQIKQPTISKTRLKPVESFEDRDDICEVTQGSKGEGEIRWK